jgi:hypothetical protein
MSNPTPGPWGTNEGIDIWIMAGFLHVATIPRADDGDWSPANARLISAAPDMLAALEAHDAYMRDIGHSDPDCEALHPKAAANWRRVRAAIAKAKGA